MTEDKMIGWHHRLNGHELGWTPGVGDGQGTKLNWGNQDPRAEKTIMNELHIHLKGSLMYL